MFNVPWAVLWILIGIYAFLSIASIITMILRKIKDQPMNELRMRINSWWVMVTIFTIATVFHKAVTISFLAFLSFLAMKEYFSLIPTRRVDRRILFWVYLSIPIQFYWAYIGWYGMFIIFIPVYMFLVLPFRAVLTGETQGFHRSMGSTHWGMMLMIFSLSHLAYLLALPEELNPPAGGLGLLIFIVLLTQFNDVFQYIWGKMIGKHKMIPKVSPNKTWEGFLGGLVTIAALSCLIGPLLTPMNIWMALVAGLLITCVGFIGDVNISSLKRDLQIKDSGSMIPGHGGILDRVDSLTYTAPVFFHYLHYLYY